MPTTDELAKILETLEAAVYRKTYRRFDFWTPYPKQKSFFEMGAVKRERLFMGGNKVGKTDTGAYEATCHLTGEYPPWWPGKKFDHPTVGWIAGVTSADVRNIQQRKLCGPPGVDSEFGSGLIPKEAFADKPSLARGVTDSFDQIQVFHKTNGKKDGISRALFKSYEQGRKTFQGDDIHFGWGDEEPEKQEVYDEFLTRLMGSGILFTTFTPMFGRTRLVQLFLDEDNADRGYVTMGLADAQHFSDEEKARRRAGYQPWEREAREYGVPMLGSGAIFLTPEEVILEPRIETIPSFWVKLWGIDFGGASESGHPFGAVLLLWDRDNDVIHVHETIRMAGALSIVQAAAMKRVGADVPVAWPRDGWNAEAHSGKPVSAGYKAHGLRMLPDHATWPDGSISTEAGITEWDDREKTGRLKIANHLSEFIEERRFYHRKDGKIVKVRDDLLSACRIGLMMKRFARAVGLGSYAVARQGGGIAKGTDFDLFGGEAA